MLTDLHVANLGVIRDVTVRFEPGMTALTGETGAGKTLLVHALQLVLGARADTALVRAGATEAAVEARFVTADDADGDAEMFLARSLPVRGRSRAWLDGRMVPLSSLEAAGAGLVDIHGQHDHQALLSVAGQRGALDGFAGADRAPLRAARAALSAIDGRLAALGGDARERARELDLLRYQIDEIEGAGIAHADEDAQLLAEAVRLENAGSLREAAAGAAAILDGDAAAHGTAPGALGRAGEAVGAISGHETFKELESRLRGVIAEIADVASELRRSAEAAEQDPIRLEAIQARRRALAELRRKYGESLGDVVEYAVQARRRVAELEAQEEEAAALERRREEATRDVTAAESALREVRLEAAPRLASAVGARLRALAMPDAQVGVEVGARGAGDDVELRLAANRGEPMLALSRVASGGELSRTMLALRLVVEGGAPTMLFDEVDAGVGGTAAVALAEALREVARTRQVLVVTHLPQVAAAADQQLAIRKELDPDGRTVTSVSPLDAPGRVAELSRMLSGHPDSATARAHAEELLAIVPDPEQPRSMRAAVSTTPRGPRD